MKDSPHYYNALTRPGSHPPSATHSARSPLLVATVILGGVFVSTPIAAASWVEQGFDPITDPGQFDAIASWVNFALVVALVTGAHIMGRSK